jgi:hypothetical protein
MSTEFYNRNWRMPNSWNGSTDNNNKVSNYSMSFDGSSEYIDLGSDTSLNIGGNLTISAWVYVDAHKNFNFIISKFTDASNRNYELYVRNEGNVTFVSNSDSTNSTTTIPINTWTHVAVTVQSGVTNGTKFYFNGTLDTTTGTTTVVSQTNATTIGRRSTGSYNFNGKLDHIAIFDYALSALQINTLVGDSTNGVGNPMSLSAKPKAFYAIGDYAAFNGTDYLVNNGALQDYNLKINPANLNQGFVISEDYGYSAFTISMWVNQDFVGRTIWVNEDTTGANTEKISISINANSFLVFNCQGGGDSYTLSTQHNLTGDDRLFGTNRWINITAVYTGTDMILYGNANSGNFVSVSASNYPAGGTVPSSITLAQNQTIIGKANLAGLSEFRGQLSNFSVFDAALPETGSESATSLFNNGTPANISSYSNLKGWWQFNADSTFDSAAGIWTSPDSSSNNNSAVGNFPNSWEKMQASYLVQSTLLITQPYSRYALSFDGTNDYIDCGTSSDLEITGDVSISAWVYIATGSAYQGIVAKRDSGGTNYQLYTDNSSTPKLRFYDGSTVTSSTGTVSLNAWHHVAITVDSGVTNGSIFYIDGVASGTATFTITSNDAPIIIGALNNGSFGSFLNGKLSNCSIWNAALTSAQVTEIYNQRKPSNLNNHSAYSNLVSWWQLGENSSFDGTNWTVLDEKGTANGTSVDMGEAAIVNGVGTSGNGVTDNMGADENIVGEAPYSTANAISYGMPVTARVSGSGNTPT